VAQPSDFTEFVNLWARSLTPLVFQEWPKSNIEKVVLNPFHLLVLPQDVLDRHVHEVVGGHVVPRQEG
jgi:hypothetical protein